MPNFMAYIKQHNLQGELDKLRLKNGKYYILPGYQRTIQVQQWIYRRDLFEKHGLKAPTTYDELFDALVLPQGHVSQDDADHRVLGRGAPVRYDGRRVWHPGRLGGHELLR